MENRKMQVFVKVDEFKDIADILALAHQRLQQARATLTSIAALKQQEDAEFEAWNQELAEIERRIETVDRAMQGKQE